jgi:hypothetical protein
MVEFLESGRRSLTKTGKQFTFRQTAKKDTATQAKASVLGSKKDQVPVLYSLPLDHRPQGHQIKRNAGKNQAKTAAIQKVPESAES